MKYIFLILLQCSMFLSAAEVVWGEKEGLKSSEYEYIIKKHIIKTYPDDIKKYYKYQEKIKRNKKVTVNKDFSSVSLIMAFAPGPNLIKLLWRPHSDVNVEKYMLERKSILSPKWENIKIIEPRLQAEYIDMDVKVGIEYRYRLIAISFDGRKSTPSVIVKESVLGK